jgi:uncharacterized protein (TIGR03067 family)
MFARTLCVFAVLALASAAGADDKIKGAWVVVSLEVDGEKAPEEDIKKSKMTLDFKDGGKVVSSSEGEKGEEDEYTVAAGEPKQINIKEKNGEMKGIYVIEGDTLKLCLSKPGSERPKEFKTAANSNTLIMVLKKKE